MGIRLHFVIAMFLGTTVMQPLANAASPAGDYETLAKGLAADHVCGFLNIIEHEALQYAVTSLERAGGTQPVPPLATCAGPASAEAVEAARPAALFVLAVAAVEAATIATSPNPLSDREKELALALNSYLDRVLGADAPQYIDPAQLAAEAAFQDNANNARANVLGVLADVSFQGVAEGAGYRATVFEPGWIRLTSPSSSTVFVGRRSNCRAANESTGSTECYLAIKDGAVVAFFRDEAGNAPPVVRLFVRRPDGAIRNAQGGPVAHTAAWRANAVGFEGRKTTDMFLGAPLYVFPPAASAALLNETANDEAELAFGTNLDAITQASGAPANLFRLEPALTEFGKRVR
jgi:hypothetical protein